ncbi:50S ribosomal protein L6 [Desulfosarcina ovata subsp. sediminis]|uniref:Large ribosomal subunit protein uL6 n=1 Tax=Desulfosarcina ovata subsp. sediminis TaxID=885957 RepID=A0A5K7ZZG3_9BACT|nr:50S ribosomal protein L6 [Desulfosarcina ovata]BBO85556.1 50S ribosomal protein L6 [Desulfosarcina ovata subsp. sediminis]
MSRVGKKVITIPQKTSVDFKDHVLVVKGEKGTLSRTIHPGVDLSVGGDSISVVIENEDRKSRSIQGLTRSLVANMVEGVSKGFEKVLEINGIGYRAEMKGNSILLNLGYSHPIDFALPEGISATVDKNNVIRLSGIDKEKVGQTAASIRKLRKPEPYKGKGIKYADEYIQRKAGKTGTK